MKTIKIILAIAAVAVIGFLVWKWFVKLEEPVEPIPPTNQYTVRVLREIDSLRKARTDVFCKKFYEDIQYRIDDYHKQGFLADNTEHNNQWQKILSKNLYSAYAPKFVEQALYVFNGSEWKIENLSFIRKELNILQNSAYLEQGSAFENSFKNIRTILSKYDEIAGFIASSSYLSYSNGIDDLFPIHDASAKIQQSKTHLSNGLGNRYVYNCTRLKDGLREIPQKLFNKHVGYLRSKIQLNSGKYSDYASQSNYSAVIYTPLSNQINSLNNDIYGVSESSFDSSFRSLEELLNTDNRNANNYFRSRNN